MSVKFKPRFFLPEETIEPQALQQVYNMSNLDVLSGPIAIMPDCHYGKGAVVGSVVPTKSAILPSALGVDLNCGMVAAKLNIKDTDLPESLAKIRAEIEKKVPTGLSMHQKSTQRKPSAKSAIAELASRWKTLSIRNKIPPEASDKIELQIGTLGGGNHFIEICLDNDKNVWLMLHSGSRNIGKTIAEVTINRAKEMFKDEIKNLPDKDLVWLPENTEIFREYTEALVWVGDWASCNRRVMFDSVLDAVRAEVGKHVMTTDTVINCHHNYASRETHNGEDIWITRKGAVSARKDEMGIIPGSMGTRSYIVRGKGNEESYTSCSHGAGRRLSRGAAKRTFSLEDLAEQTSGVECRKDLGIIDEIPGAYKDIDEVMENQKDLVEIVATLKAVLCVKG
jgi:tRNA-splicing ligase RtcB